MRHRRNLLGWLAGGTIAVTALFRNTPAAAADGEIKLADVPRKVKKAANQVVPNATWIWAGKVTDPEKTACGHSRELAEI